MRKQQEAGILEKVPEDTVQIPGKTYYIPHQLVIRQVKNTTKLQGVYDASSKVSESSLNKCLENIQTNYTDLFSVVVKVKVALIADVCGDYERGPRCIEIFMD